MPQIDQKHRRRIGLLGGSFNPPHQGHREISLAALDRLGLDAVWWLVTPGNPLKDTGAYAPIDERLHLARKRANHPDIVISDFERRHSLQYTVDTLERLILLNPDIQFVWMMGADSLAGFHHWKDWQRIAELAPMAIFNRPDFGAKALSSQAAKTLAAFRVDETDTDKLFAAEPPSWIYFSDTSNTISSTAIRNADNMTDLTAPHGSLAYFLDLHPDLGDFKADALKGLSLPQKYISPKYFYDERGSKLFNRITEVPEYYPTRTERDVFLANASAITEAVGAGAGIFEYGSGSSKKIEWLINGLENPAAYVAMDISKDHLIESASALADAFDLPVAAVCADFHAPVEMPTGVLPAPKQWLGFFPGSTIGNMSPTAAAAFLKRASQTLGPNSKFLLGVDLEKDPAILKAAYNDAAGVTAAFNLNLLERMQRELGADITLADFEHDASYNQAESRIEMHLRAIRATSITIDGQVFPFKPGETLHTENSYKYSIPHLKSLIQQTPWRLEQVFTDEKHWFAACLLSNS